MAARKKQEVEFEEVEAQLIEEPRAELAANLVPAVIEADFDGMKALLTKKLEYYQGMTRESLYACDEKELKPLRTELNSWIADIEEARKAIKRAYNEPLVEFETQCKELVAMIKEPCNIIADVIKAKEEQGKHARFTALEEAYFAFCDQNGVYELSNNVTFDRICEKQWLNKSFGEKQAMNCMEDKVANILKEWRTIKSMTFNYPYDAQLNFFETLSIPAVVAADEEKFIQSQKLEALNEEIGEVRKENETAQAVANLEAAQVTVDQPTEVYVIAVEATFDQKAQLINLLKTAGIHGRVKRTGFRSTDEAMGVLFNDR